MKLNTKRLIYIQVFLSIWLNFLTTTLNFSPALAYMGDAINILILFLLRHSLIGRIKCFKGGGFGIIAILMIFVLLIGTVGNVVNPLYTMWGIRNNFRYILFWMFCIVAFDQTDENRLFDILNSLFNVNVLFVVVQHFLMGLEQDYLGGIFGIYGGGNARMNLFLCVVLCYRVAQYMDRKIKTLQIAWTLLASLGIAVYAEMKFFFFEAVLIVALTVLFSRPSKKTFAIIIGGAFLAMLAGLSLLQKFDPYTYSIITNFDKLMAYGNMESGGYNISRFGAFRTIERLFFKDNSFYKLFGFGIGNCDASGIAALNSDFYERYGYLHYTWFSHQQWFLETGYLGFGLVVLFLCMLTLYAVINRKNASDNKAIYVFSAVFPLVLVVNLWYNNALRLECAYLTFACLAFIPCRVLKRKLNELDKNTRYQK